MKRWLGLSLILIASTVWASTTLTDRYGNILRESLPGETIRTQPVPLDGVSPWVVLATLAAEDKRFYSHPGVDFRSTARALLQNVTQGRVVSGGSTITQQLVRQLKPHPKTWRGKLNESFGALRLEKGSTKQSILETYLNTVSYGNRCEGIEAAATVYFGTSNRELSLAQAALLCGIPRSPTKGEPLRHADRALQRQHVILGRLRDWGWISPEAHRLAMAERVVIRPDAAPWTAPHFTDYVAGQVQGGILSRVRTTLDSTLQVTFQGLVATHVQRLTPSHVTNGAVIAIDNATGEVLAWVGSADYDDDQRNGQVNAVTSRRQPGSALKPFVYGLALSQGFKTSDLLKDEPLYAAGGYTPRNYDETFHGPVRLREALACSLNIPAVRLGEKLGMPAVLRLLRDFGLVSLDQGADYYGPGLVLGNGEVTLLELANAYAALSRGGIWKPVKLMKDAPVIQAPRRVLDRESSFLVTDILSDNAARARAFGLNSPFHMPFAFAAKTGTTKDYRDNWAIGYTPEWTVGVWVGNFDGEPMRGVSGITGAGPLLHDAALVMAQRFGASPFVKPTGIRDIEICPESGLLRMPRCPSTMTEVFSVHHLPTLSCALTHQEGTNPAKPTHGAEIEFPRPGDVFRIDPHTPRASQRLLLKAQLPAEALNVRWWIDHQKLQVDKTTAWWSLRLGHHDAQLAYQMPSGQDRYLKTSFLVVQ